MPSATRSRTVSALSASLLLTLLAATAHAQIRLDLPAQPLARSLTAIGTLGHINVLFDPSIVDGLQAPALKAQLSAEDALRKLLSGTQLRAVRVDANTVRVIARPIPKRTQSNIPSNQAANPPFRLAEAVSGTADESIGGALNDSSNQRETDHRSQLEEVVVTGTHIRGTENQTAPLLVFDRRAIQSSGYANTDAFMQSLPQTFKGIAGPDALLGGGTTNVESASGVNLRGLGNTSTLTLINGHRVAGSARGSFVDISLIPLDAVERIEVETDASSAVYGSDAVGGIVNFILRDDYIGAESNARVDVPTPSGGTQETLGQILGNTWDKGSALLSLQYQNRDRVNSPDRTFTANLPQPTDVYPSSRKYSAIFSGHWDALPLLTVYSDIIYNHALTDNAQTLVGTPPATNVTNAASNFLSANGGVRWAPGADWEIEASGLYSSVRTGLAAYFSPPTPGYTNGAPDLRTADAITEGNLKADGSLFQLPAGALKVAAGGSFRAENFTNLLVYNQQKFVIDRNVRAGFAELYAPLVSERNEIPLVHRFEVSAAIRYDSYSDFGATTNPKVGVHWSPIVGVDARASYSTSFRAPDPYEQIVASPENTNFVFIYPGFSLPGGGTGKAILFPTTGLTAEKARNVSAGIDFRPPFVSGLKLSVNYYNINYKNRIVMAPFSFSELTQPEVYGPLISQFGSDAAAAVFVGRLVNQGYTLLDVTGTGTTGTRYGIPYGEINAESVDTDGFDIGANYSARLGGGTLSLGANGTVIRKISTGFCSSCETTNLSNVYGQPLHFRLRGTVGWQAVELSVNAAVNYANAYEDPNTIPVSHIGSYATLDVNAQYAPTRFRGMRFAFGLINALNRDPPLTAPALNGVRYDPANADPLGRAIFAQVTKSW